MSESMLRGEAAEQAAAGLANRGLEIVKVDAYCIKWTPGSVLSWLIVRVETAEG